MGLLLYVYVPTKLHPNLSQRETKQKHCLQNGTTSIYKCGENTAAAALHPNKIGTEKDTTLENNEHEQTDK